LIFVPGASLSTTINRSKKQHLTLTMPSKKALLHQHCKFPFVLEKMIGMSKFFYPLEILFKIQYDNYEQTFLFYTEGTE